MAGRKEKGSPKTPRQVNRTWQNQARALGMMWGGLDEKPEDTEGGC